MRGVALNGAGEQRFRSVGRALAMGVFALLLMLTVVLTSPPQAVHTHSVGIAHEVTDTVATQSDESDRSASNSDAPKQVTAVLGAAALAGVVGLAFSRRRPQGSKRS
jgi:MYXO-CTERM domain-containing protein